MADPFKSTLRRTLKEIRAGLPEEYKQKISAKVCARIKQLDVFRRAKRIALYHAANGEIDLSGLWRTAPLQGKFCYFPVLNADKSLSFLPATPATPFKENTYGIAEPDVALSQAIVPSQLDLILVPLLAFDSNGTRLGMGAGYYDRTFAGEFHPQLIGVAYEFQRLSYIVRESWDIPLQAVITQSKIYWSKS